MYVIESTDVNDAYRRGIKLILEDGQPQTTRAGDVLSLDSPVTTVYTCPTQRVLFDAGRDANPFFHLFECLWMLSGTKDATWLDRFVGTFSERFAEEDGNQHGAYGFRWRLHFDTDQIELACALLRDNPTDRRVVIAMWNPNCDLGANVRDVPCNTHIYPRIVNGKLDLTVCCRSNDMIWGAYGSNAVHFSFLQEYMAGQIGVEVGVYYQISNNMHAYVEPLKKVGQPKRETKSYPGTRAIMNVPEMWDEDLRAFMDDPGGSEYVNPWFINTAYPMWTAHAQWKAGSKDSAMNVAQTIDAPDWRIAVTEWMQRRMK